MSVAPWKAPSVPWDEVSDYPVYEFRYALLRAVDVEIIYIHYFDPERVVLFWVDDYIH